VDRLDKHLVSVDKKTIKKVFPRHDFLILVLKLNYKKSTNAFHYMSKKPEIHRYSEKAIETIVEKIMNDENYLKNLRKSKEAS